MTLADFGTEIRQARKEKGLTLQAVASDLGMGIATLSRLERGDLDDIGMRRLLRVIEYLGLQLVLRPAGFGMTLDEAMKDADEALGAVPTGPAA